MVLLLAALMMVVVPPESGLVRTLFQFDEESDGEIWYTVNDGVMGGRSEGDWTISEDGTALFTGEISLANNGGFASVRTYPINADISAYDGIELLVKGDGKTYGFNLWDAHSNLQHRAFFETQAGEWQMIRISFSAFQPTSFGRVLPDAPQLDTGMVRVFGLIITDKQTGPFALEIAQISVYIAPETVMW